MRITPLNELTSRCAKLQELLQKNNIEAAVLVQNSDLFYFAGSIQKGLLYLPAEGTPLYLVIKDFGRARMESALEHVIGISSVRSLMEHLDRYGLPRPARVGMELDVLPVVQYQRYHKILSTPDIVDISLLVREVRAVKSDYEIAIMQDSAVIAEKTYEYAKSVIEVGKTDLELAAELECFARKEGHQGIVRFRGFNSEYYFGHIFSGADGAVPASLDAPLGGLGLTPAVGQGASYKPIAAGEPIIIDYIIAFDGYLVDQTRTLSIGPIDDKLTQAYADMVRIQDKLYEIAAPGVSWGKIYRQCTELAHDLGYKDSFMGSAGAQVSFIGHGIGVEVDEYPLIASGFDEQVLVENMTFAFEPKAVFPGIGAVGIENTWCVTGDGLKRLTFANENLVELSP